ncbi:MAG: TetR/AcrR family transcriptional regulator [Solirubrobacterales bacterium]|nr:TetR/AcrR family transcriptional regulator [Solirubrobacterales bacterium]
MSNRAVRSRLTASERRELIVEAGLAEFAEVGYEAASLGRIATAAGVARTVLYDHFPSKLALFQALLETEQEALVSYLRAALTSSGSVEDRWRATFDAFFRFVEEQPLAWRLLYPDRPPLDSEAADEHRRHRAEYNRLMADLLAADARRAGLEPDTVQARALFAMHRDALSGAARWWRHHPDVTRTEIVEAAMAALYTGFGGLQPG